MTALLTSLSSYFRRKEWASRTDAELLRAYAAQGSEEAFSALVARHGPLVWGLCRRFLGGGPDAEDVFQATFLTLVHQAGSIRRPESLAPWLHGVARRLAGKVRLTRAPRTIPLSADPPARADPPSSDLLVALDEELLRLPERYRAPLLLCYWQGLTQAEAARQLGCSEAAVKNRIERGRKRLGERLGRRGLAPQALLAGALATVRVPEALFRRAADCLGDPAALPNAVRMLVDGLVLNGWLRLRLAVAGLLLVGVLGVGVAVGVAPPTAGPAVRASAVEAREVKKPLPNVDGLGDPLPQGAVARLGSVRWRHEGEATFLRFSPDGNTLAVLSGKERALLFFSTGTGKRLHWLTGPDAGVPAYSPDGSLIAIQDGSASIHLWDTKTKKRIRTLQMRGGGIGDRGALCFSSDGKLLAANTGNGEVVVWDVARGKVASTISGHRHSNPALLFAPDGALLVSAGNPLVHLYDTRTGKFVRGIDAKQKHAFCLALSPGGKLLASGYRDQITLSDFATGKEVGRLETKMGGVLDLAFTPDGKTLVSGGEDNKARVWDVATRKERLVLDGRGWIGRSMTLSRDGKTVALGSVYNLVRLYDVTTGKELFEQPEGHDAPVRSVAFSPDGRLLATGGEHQQIRLWDTAGRLVRRLHGSAARLAFTPDGRQLASAWVYNPKVRLWDVARGEEIRAFPHEGDVWVPQAAFTADGDNLLSVSWQRGKAHSDVTVWDRLTGKPRTTIKLPELRWESALAVSPAGRWAAVGGQGTRPLRVIDLKQVRQRICVMDEDSGVASVAFSPDGRVLAAGALDGTTRLVEAETGQEVLRLRGHERSVAAVAFGPDGRVLATAEGLPESAAGKEQRGPQTIRFWDLATGRELARLAGHDSNVSALVFHPDGRRLVAGLSNGSVLTWEHPAAARLARPVARKLTAAEVRGYWNDLAGQDARRAADAVRALAASNEGVAFMGGSLHPAAKLDVRKVRGWLADLDSDQFAAREQASRLLGQLGEGAEAEMQRALTKQTSLEVRRRIEKLQDAFLRSPPPDRLRELRAVWALEQNGSAEARKILTRLADGDPESRLTREAKAALARRSRE